MKETLVIVRHSNEVPSELLAALESGHGCAEIVFPAQVRIWLTEGKLWKKFKSYANVFIYAPDPEIIPESATALAAALFMGKKVYSLDAWGNRRRLTSLNLMRCTGGLLRDKWRLPAYLEVLERTLKKWESLAAQRTPPPLLESGKVCYLRPDLIAGLKAGGSVGHIAGVINNLAKFSYTPTFFSVENLPLVKADFCAVRPESRRLWSQEGLPAITFSPYFAGKVNAWAVEKGSPAFIYQRHGLNTWAGAEVALACKCPFVLEYNGSEVWVAKHWGTPIAREELGIRMESLSLAAADLIVVISDPLAEELAGRGFSREKILVNPNGVNTDFYTPDADGAPTRKLLGLEDKLVIGFIGTFGRWHGAEKLAEAWGLLLMRRPDLKREAKLLFIGDGLTVQETKDVLRAWEAEATFTGTIPQAQGPAYLAACDILVAPHVPNADGSKFFGSPTKLFEYMAMGKAILASDLDQLGEVIAHEQTGLLVKPGCAEEMSEALERLIDDAPLRQKLGLAARREAENKHTWVHHTARIIDALRARCNEK